MAGLLAHFGALRKGATSLAWALWPRRCPGCDALPVAGDALALCPACRLALLANAGPRRRCCDAPAPPGTPCGCLLQTDAGEATLDGCRAPLLYVGPLASCIVRGKFGGQRHVFTGFGRSMAADAEVCALIAAADALVPVPLHPARLRGRGFNPCMLLAQALAEGYVAAADRQAWGEGAAAAGEVETADQPQTEGAARTALHGRPAPPVSTCLVRRDHAAPHSRQNRTERQRQPPTFGVRGRVPRRALLVDDVLTTGATLRAAAAVLRRAGCLEVAAVVLARRAW